MDDEKLAVPSLDLASTQEICEELARRHKCFLLVAVSRPEEAGSDLDPISVVCRGGQLNAVGMARYAERALMDLMLGDCEEDDDAD